MGQDDRMAWITSTGGTSDFDDIASSIKCCIFVANPKIFYSHLLKNQALKTPYFRGYFGIAFMYKGRGSYLLSLPVTATTIGTTSLNFRVRNENGCITRVEPPLPLDMNLRASLRRERHYPFRPIFFTQAVPRLLIRSCVPFSTKLTN
jgi:hypothetical protein